MLAFCAAGRVMYMAEASGTVVSALEPVTVQSVPWRPCGLPFWLSQLMSVAPGFNVEHWPHRHRCEYQAAPSWGVASVTESSTSIGLENPLSAFREPHTAP